MPKMIVEYYLSSSRIPNFILEGGMYCTHSATYGETYIGITTGSMSELEVTNSYGCVNVLTRNQFLSRSVLMPQSEAEPSDYDGDYGEADGPPEMSGSQKVTFATALSASWAAL